MKLSNFFITESYYSDNPKADPKIVAKFADVSDSQRSYYIMKWAEEKGIDGDDAMYMAGYVQDGYIGAGAWNWRYVGMDESIQEDEDDEGQFFFVTVGTGRDSIVVKTRAKNRREAIKSQKMKYPGQNVRIKPEENPHLEEADGVNDSGMIGEPDAYYDEEERKQAYNDLQDALDQCNSREHDYVKDGICPECGGSSYMDGDYEGEEDSCYGWGNYGCDEGELEGATWKEIMDHDKRQAERQALKDKPQPKDEDLLKVIDRLHKDYVKTGRVNAYELPGLLRQMYPEVSKPKAREIGSKFFQSFDEAIEEGYDPKLITMLDRFESAAAEDYRYYGDTDVVTIAELIKQGKKEEAAEEMAGAMSDQDGGSDKFDQIYDMALDSVEDYMHEPAMAEMRKLAGLEERAFKDVGVADVVKDRRGKEFKFDKDSKQFKSVDGEVASKDTKLGKDLMRIRKNQMKKSTPSYNKKRVEIVANEETYDCDDAFFEDYGYLGYSIDENDVFEAEYRGRKVKLNKPMQGDVKKFKVYVKDPKTGNVKKVNFGHGGSSVKGKAMKIRKNNPKARKSFRARHNCDNPGPKTKARYWSCRKW